MLYQTLYRWFKALGLTLGPLFVFVLPALLFPNHATTVEEGYRMTAAMSPSRAITPFLIQLGGAVFWLAGAIGVAQLALRRRRGVHLAQTGAALAVTGALSALVFIGMEIVQTFLLTTQADTEQMVALAGAIGAMPLYGALLMATLGGLMVGSLFMVVSLFWARVLALKLVILIALPLGVLLLPLSGVVADMAVGIGVAIPLLVVSWHLRRAERAEGRPAAEQPVGAAA